MLVVRMIISDEKVCNSSFDESTPEDVDEDFVPLKEKQNKRGNKNIVTPQLTEALDAARVSSLDAVKLLAASAQSLGVDVAQTNINRRSIHRKREQIRSTMYAKIMQSVGPSYPLTVHWDGKIVDSLEGNSRVDRIAIIVTGYNTEQFLAVPIVPSGSAKEIVNCVVSALRKWESGGNVV